MDDNRVGQSDRQNPFGVVAGNRDMYPLNESVRYQEILLHKQLKEEIEKNPASRYVDSELYLRNNSRSPAFDDVINNGSGSKSEIQSTTPKIGCGNFTTTAATNNSTNSKHIVNNNKTTTVSDNSFRDGEYPMDTANLNGSPQQNLNKNCQVCLVKEVRQDLMDLNKIIKDRNDQLMTKLRAKHMRSFFERQI